MADRGIGRLSSKPPRDFQPAPGSRVRVRGEEWAVQKSLPLDFGGYAVHVQGVSELVRCEIKSEKEIDDDSQYAHTRREQQRWIGQMSPTSPCTSGRCASWTTAAANEQGAVHVMVAGCECGCGVAPVDSSVA